MRIQAAVFRRVGELPAIEVIELDPPKDGEVLVRIAATGICGSDMHVLDGSLPEPMPLVPGHEAAGIVEEVGPGDVDLVPGDHVVLSIVPSCGHCEACRAGRLNLCATAGQMAATGTLADGTSRLHAGDEVIHHFSAVSSFATHAVVPASGAVRIDPRFDLNVAALLSCAVMTGAGAVFNTAAVPEGASVAVIGCGAVGLSVIEAARIAGASMIVAVDTRTRNLELARSVGATDAVDASASDARASILGLSPGGVDFAFEAVGSAPTIEEAWAVTAAGGALVVVGLPPKGTVVGIDTWGFIYEKRILGCFMGSARPAVDVPRLVALVDSGELRVDAMATDKVTLAELPRVLEAVKAGESIRCMVVND